MAKKLIAPLVAALTVVSGSAGYGLIQEREGLELVAYADKLAGGLPTVCWGHTGPDVKVGERWTVKSCEAAFRLDIAKFETALNKCVKVKINPNQSGALLSLTYNAGPTAICKSTIVRLINAGKADEAGDEFLRWNRAGGKVVKGLTDRRVCERALWNKPYSEPLFNIPYRDLKKTLAGCK